jgi:pimeloyl-ACP methyl ester carboxylesterase
MIPTYPKAPSPWTVKALLKFALHGTTPGDSSPKSLHSIAPLRRMQPLANASRSRSLALYQAGQATRARLIFIHGTPGSANAWARFLLDPISGCEVIALDRPGFGHSNAGAPLPSLEAQARALEATLTYYPKVPTLLIGHSYGGPVALKAAALYPNAVSAVVLVATAADPALERPLAIQHLAARLGLHHILPASLRSANAELLALPKELADLQAVLPDIRCPVHIMHGDRDPLTPIANVAYLQKHLRLENKLTIDILAKADHFLPWKHAEHLRATLLRLLESLA